ncbi:MAG: V-type ATP synthase subunit E family protein [Candidatus Thorarchaeota archaeon]
MSGVQSIIKMIEGKAAEKEDKIIRDARKLSETKLLDARKKGKAKRAAMMVEAEIQFRVDSVKRDANARLAVRHKILEAKEALITEVIELAIESLTKKHKTKDYADMLVGFAIEGGSVLAVEEVELILPKRQSLQLDLTKISREIAKRTGHKTGVSLSKEKIRSAGGVLIRSKDGTKWVDNTFEGRRDRVMREMRKLISSILFENIDTSI